MIAACAPHPLLLQVDRLIEQQPFHLLYQNSQGQVLAYTVRYAEVLFYEKRYYLQIWCDETEDSQDLPELQHNRCFRLDRIQSIFPTRGEWQGKFDTIDVQLHLTGWSVRAYEPKPEDISNELIGELRQVTRRVVNPFWLMREVFRYGEECVIVSPESVRERFKQKGRSLYARYEPYKTLS